MNKIKPYYLIPAYVGIHLVLKNYMKMRWDKVNQELLLNPCKLKAYYLSDHAFYEMIIKRENVDLLESIMEEWVNKNEIDTITFDDYEQDGRTLWDLIHDLYEWKEYLEACKISGNYGLGVYDIIKEDFIECCMAENYNAIKIIIRKHYPNLTIVLDKFEDGEATKDEIKRLDNFIMSDNLILAGNVTEDKDYYTPTSRKY